MFNSVTPWTIACQAPLSIGFSRPGQVQISLVKNELGITERAGPSQSVLRQDTLFETFNVLTIARWM